MKYPKNVNIESRAWRMTTLSVAVMVGLATVSTPAYSATGGKKIGDLEIYEAAEGGKVSIMMMLDTSGSMSSAQTDVGSSACDLPTGISSNRITTEPSATTPSYTRRYCIAGGDKQYYYRRILSFFSSTWYRCGGSAGLGTPNKNSCNAIINQPSTNGFETESSGFFGSTIHYYKSEGGSKYYDRLTRLKDAIFTLMDNTQLDPKKVAIGIGQFSSQSGADNSVSFNASDGTAIADGKSGKILVPAALLDDNQRAKIKAVVAAAGGGNGTPTANAYAEAGAYMLGTNTPSTSEYSGFNKSVSASKRSGNYISPLVSTTSQSTAICDGQGIYFLTDGKPNGAPDPAALMRSALGSKGGGFSVPSIGTLPSGSDNNSGMPAVGAFAKALRNSSLNPLGENRNILTAVVGFGSDFTVNRAADASLPEANRVIRNLPVVNSKGEEEYSDFYNCNNITDLDAKNACNWGAKSHPELPSNVGGFGEGGFYSAQSTDDIVKSITTFVEDLDQTLPSAPSGTITVPDDPYQASNQLAYAYLPMLTPDVSSRDSIWEGNLKKYKLNRGTLFGKNNNRLYTNSAGNISKTTQDVWQTADYKNSKGETVNNEINAGGVYAQLRTPKSDRASVRKIYVEDYESVSNKKPVLRELSVDTTGKPIGFNLLVDTAIYTQQNKRRLLNFLGFEKAIKADGQELDLVLSSELPLNDVITSELTLVKPSRDIKVLGGVVHSSPTALSYSAVLDDNGRITDSRDDYVLFGSMDGALHLVDADEGKEMAAIIPRSMLIAQPSTLVDRSTKTEIGQPYFGIDAPWLVTTDYKYDLPAKRVKVDSAGSKGMFAYGGLRMGGEALYGMDITDKSAPKMKFTITPEGLNYTASNDFKRLGQIWNKPIATKVRLKADDAKPTNVLIFGGGYDMGYESETYVPTAAAPAKGNAIYMVNAQTGELIWSTSGQLASGSSKNVVKSEMIHSIVGEITVLDRDSDGLTDHIYAADLGGQVFRVDLQNARPEKYGFTRVGSFSAKPAVRILNTKPNADGKFAYRFYERPIVSFYRRESGPDNGQIFGLINVVSGNRSAPLSKIRDNNTYANRVYGIIDSDLTRRDLFTTSTLSIQNLTEANLTNLASTLGNTPTDTAKNNAKATMITGTKKGWYYPLIRFDGENNVKYNKGFGDSAVINSLLFTTVYNPDKQYGTVNNCTAKIRGGSERQLYCLPYGICAESTSITGTGGFIPAGQGIQELVIGPYNKDNTNLKVLVGVDPIDERIKPTNRKDFNDGGDGSASEYIFNERYTVQPRVWYKRTQ